MKEGKTKREIKMEEQDHRRGQDSPSSSELVASLHHDYLLFGVRRFCVEEILAARIRKMWPQAEHDDAAEGIVALHLVQVYQNYLKRLSEENTRGGRMGTRKKC